MSRLRRLLLSLRSCNRLLLAGALLSASCSHTYVHSFGKGYLRVCGNQYAEKADFEEMAAAKGCANAYADRAYTGVDRCVVFNCQVYFKEER